MARDSGAQRTHDRIDREIWFRDLELNRKEEILFELEMYLRAIGCFFNLHNQFLPDPKQAISRDFSQELKVLSAALERGIALSQMLIDRGLASSMDFQSYIENQIAPDFLRFKLLRKMLDQRNPSESLYMVNRCFRDFKKVIDQLTRRPPCTYPLFFHLGQLITREIAFNRFFNPLLILEFRPEYDRIRSVMLLDAMRDLESSGERRAASTLFLALYRLLHYLRYIPRRGKPEILRRSLILFTLFHSEATTLVGYLKMVHQRQRGLRPAMVAQIEALASELAFELERLFGRQQVWLDLQKSTVQGDEERTVESSREILESFLKDCILRLARVFLPEASRLRLFDDVKSQADQSVRLRADLWLFRELLDHLLAGLRRSPADRFRLPVYPESYSGYFLDTSYNFLRYGDGGPFERFHSLLTEMRHIGADREFQRKRFLQDATRFRGFLTETYDSVCKRAELASCPLDLALLKRNLAEWVRPEGEPD